MANVRWLLLNCGSFATLPKRIDLYSNSQVKILLEKSYSPISHFWCQR